MITVPVELGARRYDVVVGPGARAGLAGLVAERLPTARRLALVTQPALAELPWFADLDPGLPFDVHPVPEGEVAKSLGTVEALCRAFARHGLARSDAVVAVGGGVVTDVAGFAAAAYHRGVAYANVATTLLGQVDAAIGGKTGVNLPEGKNLVGAFWQPVGVLCDTDTLATLPPREWACGRGEMAKYAFLTPDTDWIDGTLAEQVAACAGCKAAVVADDEREGARRQLLNYGHTLAHALETSAFADQGMLRHGEAVAVGLLFAALLAQRLGRIDDARVAQHRAVLSRLDLAGGLPRWADPQVLVELMGRDKKARHDLAFVLDGPDGLETVHNIERATVLATLLDMEKACG